MITPLRILHCAVLLVLVSRPAAAQPYGEADRGETGDGMIQAWLAQRAAELHDGFAEDVASLDDWQERRQRYRQEYFHMLGLDPLPEKTPLQVTVTGTYEGDGFVVEKLHYQSRPRLYVTANLYRPPQIEPGDKLPAVLYVCGHAGRGRNGNKTAYQSHGIWFARHGYLCLMVDTLQLGEIAAIHHGTYRESRWWWHSRGYTPAGVECWNGIRGIDYLISRPEVDPERIAVTGISGGGAATFWVAAADERVKVAVPVSGMADLPSYVSNRVINGHCDCMFLYNTFQWPWVRIAALIAPRPMLFTNSDNDRIFPMDANERLAARLERVYSLYGRSHDVDAMVSIGGHAYREDIRRAAFRFINTHLKHDPRPITDSEVDLVTGDGNDREHPIPPEELRAFPNDDDLPKDELNTSIDEHFVPIAEPTLPSEGDFEAWKERLTGELRRISFRAFPERIPAAAAKSNGPDERIAMIETEPGIRVPLVHVPLARRDTGGRSEQRIVLLVRMAEVLKLPEWLDAHMAPADELYVVEPRGGEHTRWTTKDPPNYVERSHVLLGRTVDTGRVWDVIAAARHLRETTGHPVHVAGEGAEAVLAAYAALWEPEIAGVVAHEPSPGHMTPQSPQFLNVLRVCDVPDVLGMLAPRPLVLSWRTGEEAARVRAIYAAAGAADRLTVPGSTAEKAE
ncbi:MAG: prolyl oligopeptidase family serine peptidase [Planctomycetes bacterium]|nr:prolyl oligopeptidase family serine peptidase [Planctomycetota bacterium]